jgi:hypothetical protein
VQDLAEETPGPARVVGLHFFFHPAKNRLVEVIGPQQADAEVLKAAWRFMEKIGKTPIRSADSPGFIVNRFFVPWLNEAARLLEEGVASAALIDRVAKEAFQIGMGPFELMNVTGVPIAYHAAKHPGSGAWAVLRAGRGAGRPGARASELGSRPRPRARRRERGAPIACSRSCSWWRRRSSRIASAAWRTSTSARAWGCAGAPARSS